MKVSFLIATNEFNELLCNTIESCLNQRTSFDFEILVVCNGNCRYDVHTKLQQRYNDRLTLAVSNVQGLIAALNYGLSLCKGELVARIDTGDLCEPDRLQKQIQEFNNNDMLVLLGAQMENYPVASVRKKLPTSAKSMRIYGANPIAHPTVMYRLSVIRSIGGYKFPDAAEDYGLWLEILAKNKGHVQNMEDVVTKYYYKSNNNTRKNPDAYFGIFLYSIYLFRQTRRIFLLIHAFRNLFVFFLSKRAR